MGDHMAPRPNNAFKSLIERYPDETRPILDKPELIILMNAWANFHAGDPASTFEAYYQTKLAPILNRTTGT